MNGGALISADPRHYRRADGASEVDRRRSVNLVDKRAALWSSGKHEENGRQNREDREHEQYVTKIPAYEVWPVSHSLTLE